MAASLALGDLDDVVTRFEQHGGVELLGDRSSWMEFLETLDQLKDVSDRLQGLADAVFSKEFARSETAADASKSRPPKRRAAQRS